MQCKCSEKYCDDIEIKRGIYMQRYICTREIYAVISLRVSETLVFVVFIA